MDSESRNSSFNARVPKGGNLPEHPDVRSEGAEVRFRWTFAFVVASLLGGSALLCVVWILFESGESYLHPRDVSTTHQRDSEPGLPRNPRLEQLNRIAGEESGRIRHLELVDLRRLHRYGLTEEAGFAHIPIERAMGLIVSRLPMRDGSDNDDFRNRGLSGGGGEANSGRVFMEATP